jgi:hypothetical protein
MSLTRRKPCVAVPPLASYALRREAPDASPSVVLAKGRRGATAPAAAWARAEHLYCSLFSKPRLREWRARGVGPRSMGRSVAKRRMEIAGVVVGKPAVEGFVERGRAGHSRSDTNSSFNVLRNRSVSALPLGLL